LGKLKGGRLFKNRDAFKSVLDPVLEKDDFPTSGPLYKAILNALSERDPKADVCVDSKGDPEPDPELRDTESIALPSVPLPLPLEYRGARPKEPDNEKVVAPVRKHCESYFDQEIKPYWPDAWIEYSTAASIPPSIRVKGSQQKATQR
jgi:type I restriction enzyme M protein